MSQILLSAVWCPKYCYPLFDVPNTVISCLMSQILLSAVWCPRYCYQLFDVPNTVIRCLMYQILLSAVWSPRYCYQLFDVPNTFTPPSRLTALLSCVVSKWATEAFYSAFWLRIQVMYWQRYWLLHGWCHVKLLPSRLSTRSVYTIQLCTSMQCHFLQSHIHRVYVFLAVTCLLHFWQNDQDLLRATAVTLVCNGNRNNNQHRKCTLEKTILRPFLPGLEPATFRSRVRRSNHWATPGPLKICSFFFVH